MGKLSSREFMTEQGSNTTGHQYSLVIFATSARWFVDQRTSDLHPFRGKSFQMILFTVGLDLA
ncbi:hypothetical protein Q3C01_31955 [Bradyrhizobium sp. UFLA05-109]